MCTEAAPPAPSVDMVSVLRGTIDAGRAVDEAILTEALASVVSRIEEVQVGGIGGGRGD